MPRVRGSRHFGIRAWVGGILCLEGIICLLLGLLLLLAYWPPLTDASGNDGNPISYMGLWITGVSLVYMILVGTGFLIYNRLRPSEPEAESPLEAKANRYRARDNNRVYLFDETILREEDAEQAWMARQLY